MLTNKEINDLKEQILDQAKLTGKSPMFRHGKTLASYIDHTALGNNVSEQKVEQLAQEATTYNFASICIPPYRVPQAYKLLKPTLVRVCTVISFPYGADSQKSKTYAALDAIDHGADEIDMVINIAAAKEHQWEVLYKEIHAISKRANGIDVKTILETSELTDEEKVLAATVAIAAGATFVKTSTGMSSKGATVEDIKLLRKTVGKTPGVKASGGVRTLEFAETLIESGADRIGSSNSVNIMKELKER